jgi:hypothetical protein
LAGCFSASVAQAAIVIDPFTAEQYLEIFAEPIGPRTASDSLNPAGVLGGERDIVLERTSNNGGGVAGDISLSFVGAVAYASDVATTGRALIVYDGVDADAAINFTGLGGVDLTEGGLNDRFDVGVASDLGSSMVITVYTDATHYSTATIPVPADPTYTFHVSQLPFASFTPAGPGGGAVFTSVGAITVAIDGSIAATDVLVNYFVVTGEIPPQEVPEPPTIVCPPDMTVFASGTNTSAVVNYPAPVVTVDPQSAFANVVASMPSGSSFPLGTTTVIITVQDSFGQTDQCSFTVTVKKAFTPLSPGYWKNHPCAWPVSSLTLGNQTYTKSELLKILKMPKGGDASLILAFQLIAAKLNVLSGADPAPISGLVTQGDALLSLYPGKLPYKVKTASTIGSQMTAIGNTLSALWY